MALPKLEGVKDGNRGNAWALIRKTESQVKKTDISVGGGGSWNDVSVVALIRVGEYKKGFAESFFCACVVE